LGDSPRHLVLGTAGHIDHGKTALIRALTGVDTDRLPEEKARGITIELGFAPLDLGGGLRLGVVDVPGHEALVRTMVAGATGIDLVMLVVAADEGVMPQTREHVAICELLGVQRGIVALTKVDAASEEIAELAEAEVVDLLAGTSLADAPVLRVSALSGEGIEGLRQALREVASEASARTPRHGAPRLPVDRCFAMRGFGAVVTGTLVGSSLSVGDSVELLPSGKRARVRGLQRHGEAADSIEPGARCAVNLQGVEVDEVSRGDVLTLPDVLTPTVTFDASLHWLDVAPASDDSLSVELLTGTLERRARVAPIGAEGLRPGSNHFARVHVEGDPLPLLPSDRFILRGFARTAMGGTTLGGGAVLDVAPPHRRRSDPKLAQDLAVLAERETGSGLELRIRRAGLAGVRRASLLRETGLSPDGVDEACGALVREGRAVAAEGGLWLSAAAAAELEGRLEQALDSFHTSEPLQSGMPAGALRGTLPGNVPPEAVAVALERLAERGAVRLEADRARRPDHRPELEPAQRELAERVVAAARECGLEPPSLRDWSERLGVDSQELAPLLGFLEREGRLVRAPGDLWFDRGAVDALRERVLTYLDEHGELQTPAYKELIGTTRRTAVPLMELFDSEHVTIRRGDRRLRGRN